MALRRRWGRKPRRISTRLAVDVPRLILETRDRVPSDRSVLVAITGGDGCGKGFLAAKWRGQLQAHGLRIALIGVDGWLNLPDKRFGGPDRAEHFYTHALRLEEMFSQLILPLRDRRSIRVEADFAEETATTYRKETYEFYDTDIILLEGIYLLKRKFQAHYDASFWIECTFDTALERAIQRRQEGLSDDQTTQAYRSIYFPAQELHFQRDDPKHAATAVVTNDPRLIQPTGALMKMYFFT